MWRTREALRTRTSACQAALTVAMSACVWFHSDASTPPDVWFQAGVDKALKRESEALVAIADAAASGRDTPADFTIAWQNDFFKAHPGTFVPFTITFDARDFVSRHALMYVRAERRSRVGDPSARSSGRQYAYETIYPLALRPGGERILARRGFAVPPGSYAVTVVIREASQDLREPLTGHRQASTLLQDLDVPDFWTAELATSTVMLAERLERLSAPVPADELDEDPYVVGAQRIHPASSRTFRRNRELIVVFLVYNPTVGPDKHFDVQVDYHLYRRDHPGPAAGTAGDQRPARPSERYVTRTNPQRFNPSLMSGFDPAAGAPILAGQGILLSAFEPGEYRLGITVTDLLSRKSLSRDVAFTVIGS